MFKQISFSVAILLLYIWFSSQSIFGQTIDLNVNGVEINNSYADVIKKLGKPAKSKKDGNVPCSDGSTRSTLHYSGLILKLESNPEVKDFGVYKVEVTSAKWSVRGVRIGDSKEAVFAKFGKGNELFEVGRPYLAYFIVDGYASFYFHDERLAKIVWEFNFC